MRFAAMGCAGVENVLTPNLDRLASEGTRFTNAITNTPVCSTAVAEQYCLGHDPATLEIPFDSKYASVVYWYERIATNEA